jgi:Fe-S-cluster containining protein
VTDCQPCGACCAIEPAPCTEREAAELPSFFVFEGPTGRVVKQHDARCVALLGRVGLWVSCMVYDDRPRCCREFAAGGEACQAARRRHGLEGAA